MHAFLALLVALCFALPISAGPVVLTQVQPGIMTDAWFCTSNATCTHHAVDGIMPPNPHTCFSHICTVPDSKGMECLCGVPRNGTHGHGNSTGPAHVPYNGTGPSKATSNDGKAWPNLNSTDSTEEAGWKCDGIACMTFNEAIDPKYRACIVTTCFPAGSDGKSCVCPTDGPWYNPVSVIGPKVNATSVSAPGPVPRPSKTKTASSNRPWSDHTFTGSYTHGRPSSTATRPAWADGPLPRPAPHAMPNTQPTSSIITDLFSTSTTNAPIPPSTTVEDMKTKRTLQPCPSPKLNPQPPYNFVCPEDDDDKDMPDDGRLGDNPKYCLNPVIDDKPPYAFVCPP